MINRVGLSLMCLLIIEGVVSAQTTVTTSGGTTNSVPLFTGASTLGSSAITQSSGNVGIGTTAPDSLLEVGNPNVANTFHSAVGGGYAGLFENVYTGYGGNAMLLWVKSANQNAGSYHFYVQGNGNPEFVVQGNGNVGIGTASPTVPEEIAYGTVSNYNQVYNALKLRPAVSNGAYAGNGSSVLLGAATNSGIQPVAGIWSSLTNGGSGSGSYAGALVLASTIAGQTAPTEVMRIDGSGNVGIKNPAPAYALDVAGTIRSSSGGMIYPDGSSQTTAWTGVLCGGDYAEAVEASGDLKRYGPGDVLVLSSNNKDGEVEKASEPYSTMVAGVYATRPGVIGRRQTLSKDSPDVPMAMVGIVPTKVSAENGPIKIGDLLVSASIPGYAMKGTDRNKMLGAVIGKAMSSLDSGTGLIEVLVTLQ